MVRLTQDLTSSKWIYTKGFLLLLISLISAALILIQVPRWDILALLLICLWASCRSYYFAFYVIQNYVDPDYRFSGLFDFTRYLLNRNPESDPDDQSE
jgi:glucan phosphoethanolaminetransferase (alkaline phosphatase superfamily)